MGNQGEGIGIVNLNEEFTFANPAAEKLFGVHSSVKHHISARCDEHRAGDSCEQMAAGSDLFNQHQGGDACDPQQVHHTSNK